MFATTIKVDYEDRKKKLYEVRVVEPQLIFLRKVTEYKHLTENEVKALRVPFGMFIGGIDVPFDCFPERF